MMQEIDGAGLFCRLEGREGAPVVMLSNSLGTTLGQLAQGGATNDNWYIGFNISRKFF